MYLIYKHTCTPTGKSYIGQTSNINKRNDEHRRPSSGCQALRNAVQKYGWSQFTTEILAENLSQDEANELEPQLIVSHNTRAPNGYNLAAGGLNHSHSAESRARMSEAKLGKPRPQWVREKLRGRKCPHRHPERRKKKAPLTQEHKDKIRQSMQGRRHTTATIDKMRAPRSPQPIVRCPHCKKEGGQSLMLRWHFSNCKHHIEEG